MFKTTFSLDKESFYYLYHIALLELKNDNGVFNLNQILKSSINFFIDNKNKIDIKTLELQYIIKTDKNKYIIFYNGLDSTKIFLDELLNDFFKIHNFNLKYNQIIKIIIFYRYNYLLNTK